MLTRRVCPLCGEVGANRRGSLCGGCRADLPARQDPAHCPCGGAPRASACPRCQSRALIFDDCVAACAYRYPVDLMIKKIKYQGQLDLILPLADLLAERIDSTNMTMPECLLPVPLHAARFRQRGFNQAREIARALARRLPDCRPGPGAAAPGDGATIRLEPGAAPGECQRRFFYFKINELQ